jgi:hypothetical protein
VLARDHASAYKLGDKRGDRALSAGCYEVELAGCGVCQAVQQAGRLPKWPGLAPKGGIHWRETLGSSGDHAWRLGWVGHLLSRCSPPAKRLRPSVRRLAKEIGDRLVSDVSMSDVLEVLSPIWLTKAETARRLRQRIRLVLERARIAGQRDGVNPADAVGAGLPKQSRRTRHHAARFRFTTFPRLFAACAAVAESSRCSSPYSRIW